MGQKPVLGNLPHGNVISAAVTAPAPVKASRDLKTRYELNGEAFRFTQRWPKTEIFSSA